MILFIKNHIIWFPSVQHCNWFGFRISLSLSREGAIFRDEIENYFSCSRLARRDRDYHMTILVFRDENEIPFCYSHVSRRDRDFRKSFLVVEREKMKLTLVENSRDREFSLTSACQHDRICCILIYASFFIFLLFLIIMLPCCVGNMTTGKSKSDIRKFSQLDRGWRQGTSKAKK